MAATQQLDTATIRSLGNKLDEFSEVLSDEEKSVLLGLMGLAGSTIAMTHRSAETEGVSADRTFVKVPSKFPRLSESLNDTFKEVSKLRDPLGPVSDSVGVGWLCVSWSKDYMPADLGDKVINPATRDQVINPAQRAQANAIQSLNIEGLKTYR